MNEDEVIVLEPVEAPVEVPAELPAEPVEAPAELPEDTVSNPAEDASQDVMGENTETTETVQVLVLEERPFMTTSFEDYTVTEGLLLLVFLLLFADVFSNFLRRWF